MFPFEPSHRIGRGVIAVHPAGIRLRPLVGKPVAVLPAPGNPFQHICLGTCESELAVFVCVDVRRSLGRIKTVHRDTGFVDEPRRECPRIADLAGKVL